MRVCLLSANLGRYDQPAEWPALESPAGVTVDVIRLTDTTCPPRPLAMTSRLQCGIPKWFGTDFAPTADVIIWIDASCAPTPHAVRWFLDRLHTEIAVFRHPERATVRDECAFMQARMRRPGERYLTSRYQGEWLAEEFREIEKLGLAGLPLYASTAFAYRPTARVRLALADCFTWKARYCLHDQLAFPVVLHQHGCRVSVIPDHYMKCDGLTFVRTGVRRSA